MSEIVNVDNVQAISRTPLLIAAEINNIKEQTRKLVLYNSIEIGRRLIEAKSMIGHGEWGQWLEKSVDYSQRTANNLMKIFEEYGAAQLSLLGENLKSQAFANLSYTQAIALIGIEESERESFVKDNKVEEMSTRELEKAIKENKELQNKLKLAEKEAEEEKKLNEKLKKENTKKDEQSKELKQKLGEAEAKTKEALLNREVEIENLNIAIKDMENKLKAAEESGNEEDVDKLHQELNTSQSELIELNKKVVELEQKLQEKPIDVNEIVVEKVPEDIEKELQELREKVKSQTQNKEVNIKFKINFEKTVDSVKSLLGSLEDIKNNSSEEEYSKYKMAVSAVIDKLKAKVI